MSPLGLVDSVPESTALRPFTPFAPPADRLIRSQPYPSGWQLTAGGAGSGAILLSTGSGITCAPRVPSAAAAARARAAFASGFFVAAILAPYRSAAVLAAAAAAVAALVAAAAFAEPRANDAVDGVTVGPVSRSQPLAQPVAAGPVKVGV